MATHELVAIPGEKVGQLPTRIVRTGEKLTFQGKLARTTHIVLETQTTAGFIQVLAATSPRRLVDRLKRRGTFTEALSLAYYGIIDHDQLFTMAFEPTTSTRLQKLALILQLYRI